MKYSPRALAIAALLLAGCGGSSRPADECRRPAAAADDVPDDGDWTQWGGTPSKNMVSQAKNLPFTFHPGKLTPDGDVDLSTAKNVLWAVKLGSQTYGTPAVSNGRVFIGTNNEGRNDPRFRGDYSRLLCLEAATGNEIWSLTVPKLGTGKVGDWEFLGICSQPTIVGNRVYAFTNRGEVIGLDTNGLADGNQGDQDEGTYMGLVGTTPGKPKEVKPKDADILWRYNMIQELGVFPHNITTGSPLVIGDMVYCNTSNGVTYDHTEVPSPKAPTFIALNRKAAERPGVKPGELLAGEEGSGISRRIFHAAWTGLAWAELDGKGVLIYGGPDGFLYAFDPMPVKDSDGFGIFPEKWRFDCVPAPLRYRDGDPNRPIKYASLGDGPSEILATPVVYKGRVYVGIGQDPEHRAGPGHFSCVDVATGRQVWAASMDRTLSTCAIADDLVYVSDLTGWLYCLDANNGTVFWKYDTESEIWCSPLLADKKVFMGTADGTLLILAVERLKRLTDPLGPGVEIREKRRKLVLTKAGKVVREVTGDEAAACFNVVRLAAAINCTPVASQGVVYVATMRHLYAVKEGGR